MSYIDLVYCKNKQAEVLKYLVCAPAWSGLEEDDEIMIEADSGAHVHAVVITKATVEENGDAYNLIVKATIAKKPLPRVSSQVLYRTIKWEDEEDERSDQF